jgi:membrane-associated protease RseP (regulator of RpoE activity)
MPVYPDPYFLSIIAFIAFLAYVIHHDRKHIEVHHFVLLMRRTQRFRRLLDDIANRTGPRLLVAGLLSVFILIGGLLASASAHSVEAVITAVGLAAAGTGGIVTLLLAPKRWWMVVGTLAVIATLYYMAQGMWLLGNIAYMVGTGEISQPALQLILPTPSATGASGPGYILIPFWFWLITIAAILIPHEFLHGIIARAEKISLKSVGLLLLLIFPGAFVEPNEKQLKKASLMKQLRIYAAGSFANFMVALLIIIFVSFMLWPWAALPGITLLTVNSTSPAAAAGLTPGMELVAANGNQINVTYNEYLGGHGFLWEELGPRNPGDRITLTTSDNTVYDVTLGQNNNVTYLGITYMPHFKVDPNTFMMFMQLLTLMFMFSFAVGLFNILPIWPLDGGLMVEAIAKHFSPKNASYIVRAISTIVLLIVIFSFIGPSLYGAILS